MALTYKIKDFTDEKVNEKNTLSDDGTLKKRVGFAITDEKNNIYAIDKWLTIVDGKSDDDYIKEAYDLCKTQIDNWQNSMKNLNKTFNPDTGKTE